MRHNRKIAAFMIMNVFLFSNIVFMIAPNVITSDSTEGIKNNTGIETLNPQSSAGRSKADWWNIDWLYRISLNITADNSLNPIQGINYTNKLITRSMNFTYILAENRGNFDNQSVRVIEYTALGVIIGEIPSKFECDSFFQRSTNATGILYWVMNGTTLEKTTRYYLIYFDVLENGQKSAPVYETGIKLTLNRANDYTLENNEIRVSFCQGAPPGGGSGYDHMYEIFNKNTGRDQQRSAYRWGFCALYNWNWAGYYSSNFNGITYLEIILNNSIVLSVRGVMVLSNLRYEQYFTINHLDNTVELWHRIIARQSIVSTGDLYFRSWMNPGRGDNSYTSPISAYGIGGFNFGSGYNPSLGTEFSSNDLELYPTYINGWPIPTVEVRREAWFAHWDNIKMEGVGTVWTPDSNDFYRWGYRGAVGSEGQGLYVRLRLYNKNPGDVVNFKVWGVIFNGFQGDYVKARAKGLQFNPTQEIGDIQDSGKMLKYQIKDLDGRPINGAEVQLFNSTNTLLFEGLTDSDGNVTIRELYNDTFTIKSFIDINNNNFTLKESIKVIDQTQYERFNFLSVTGNLTIVKFYVIDADPEIDPTNAALPNANVTILNTTNGQVINFLSTDISGRVEFLLPSSTYNVTVRYVGVLRDINLNISTGTHPKSKNFILNSEKNIRISVILTENKTRITIEDVQYLKINEGWSHSQSIIQYPYTINMYRGDASNISFYYENVKTYIYGLNETDTKTWELNNTIGVTIDSGNMVENDPLNQPGNHSVMIDSRKTNYIVGSYVLTVYISKTNCQPGILQVLINILNQTSSLLVMTQESDVDVYWAENLSIYVNYKSTVNASGYNITDASLSYKLEGDPSIFGSLIETEPGVYRINRNTSILALGSYIMNIYGFASNITPQTLQVEFSVLGLPTDLGWEIPNNIKVSSLLIKVADGENVSLSIQYTSLDEYIPDATVYVRFNNTDVYDVIDEGDGNYTMEFNSSVYDPGFGDLQIFCTELHHETETYTIQLQILDFWNTQIELKVPPSFYPWSNNASFRFNYFCNEFPRYGTALSNGFIDQLNVTIENAGVYETAVLYTMATKGENWGSFNLGNGLYEVWFNTSSLEITENTVFYAEPRISQLFYRSNIFNPYVWIRPPRTTVSSFFGGYSSRPTESYELFLNDFVWVNITYNVTDTESDLDGKMLAGATMTYSVYNSTNALDILTTERSISEDLEVGYYILKLSAVKIGVWKVNFTASLGNYSSASTIVILTVNDRELKYELGSGMERKIIATPQNIEFNMSIQIFDQFNDLPLSDVNVSFIWEGTTYEFNYGGNGIYSLMFTTEMLSQGVEDATYNLLFTIQKTNYTEEEISISLDVGLQVDPYLKLPIRYWIIIGVTVGSMVGVFAVSKGVAYARIPIIVKQINKTMSSFQKNRKVSAERIRPSRDETVATLLADRWEKIGLKYPTKPTEGTRNPQEELEPSPEGGN